MIPVPAGTQIWVSCGTIDMRKGIDGLAMLAQEVVKKSPYCGTCSRSAASGAIGSRSCGGTARACAFTPSGWSVDVSYGR